MTSVINLEIYRNKKSFFTALENKQRNKLVKKNLVAALYIHGYIHIYKYSADFIHTKKYLMSVYIG